MKHFTVISSIGYGASTEVLSRCRRKRIICIRIALLLLTGVTRSLAGSSIAFDVHAIPVTEPAPLSGYFDTSTSATGFSLSFPEKAEIELHAATNCWMTAGALAFDLHLPEDVPADTRLLVFMVDADHNWFQHQSYVSQAINAAKHVRVDLSASAVGWDAHGHFGRWHHRVRMRPRRIGLRLFSDSEYEGVAAIDNIHIVPAAEPEAAPEIQRIRVLTPEAMVYARYELAVDLPDRYDNPFDPASVTLMAEITQPDGNVHEVPGFYYQSYYRQHSVTDDRLIPQGKPHWRIRYTPMMPGRHRVTLTVKDHYGADRSQALEFNASPPQRPGFARVSETDPRFFEFGDGTPFFPIGHNLRSPFDDRMHRQFPWAIRHPEGARIYERFFREMEAHGENITEIWMAAWSLGIEWSRTAPGYHGIGQYNLIHAWELDRVIEEAERRGIYINLVIHNHGKFSTHWDTEWDENPYNKAVGGYLEKPEDYFTDERAFNDFEQLMQYIISRWGSSPNVFAWKLWNELDLTGSQRERVNHLRAEVVEWHRRMGRRVKEMDPYRHMIGTHFCGDYTHQNPEIVQLPEMDFSLIDAYHSNPNPLHIVELMRRTAIFNNRFDKPVLITEFGGSPHAATLEHLDGALHAGLWSSTAIPLGGAPMLWWWGLIEEQHYYRKFRALANFMDGEDRRNPDATLRHGNMLVNRDTGETHNDFMAFSFSDGRNGLGWMADTNHFSRSHPPVVSNLVMRLDDMSPGKFTVEFWETENGTPIYRAHTTTSNRLLDVEVPAFSRDLAFKIRFLENGDHP